MSDGRGPVIYGLESQGRALTARALTARAGETDKIHFLCGTQSLRQENQVHLLEYDEEAGVLDKTVYVHSQGEIW
jgi:isopentenyl diphosphate isomerase/L-lactate dehydrogenase-like FMN-dependent dehydrogenase